MQQCNLIMCTNIKSFLRFGQGSFSMDMIISETISHFSSKFDYDEVCIIIKTYLFIYFYIEALYRFYAFFTSKHSSLS